MHTFRVLFAILIAFLCTSTLYAAGTYYIGRDAGGVYFQTYQDGGWYIDKEDLRYFKIGQTGTYSIKRDRNRTFMITDKKENFILISKLSSSWSIKLQRLTESINKQR